MRIVDAVAPPRLGVSFRWLLASSWTANLGDGFSLAAGPLLIAAQSRDPRLVALALLLQQLPWLLFGLHAGAIVDRVDRRLVVVTMSISRAVVLALLSAAIITGTVGVAPVLIVMFLLGLTEVFGATASATLLPMLVARRDLPIANARVQTGLVVVNQLVGPPIGAGMFAAGMALPFVGEAALISVGALLVSRVRLPAEPEARTERTRINADIAEGFRWIIRSGAVRTLVLTIFTFNITFGAAWSVLVLYARERLGLGAVGFGLLTAATAVGGIIATTSYGWITRHWRLSTLMRIGLVIETLTHLGLALTTTPAVAIGIFFVFGGHAFVWGTTSATVRQRAVPIALQGRVASVNSIGTYSGIVVGAALGGPIASRWGITAPFWFAFVGSALFVTLIWRELRHIAHQDDDESDPGLTTIEEVEPAAPRR